MWLIKIKRWRSAVQFGRYRIIDSFRATISWQKNEAREFASGCDNEGESCSTGGDECRSDLILDQRRLKCNNYLCKFEKFSWEGIALSQTYPSEGKAHTPPWAFPLPLPYSAQRASNDQYSSINFNSSLVNKSFDDVWFLVEKKTISLCRIDSNCLFVFLKMLKYGMQNSKIFNIWGGGTAPSPDPTPRRPMAIDRNGQNRWIRWSCRQRVRRKRKTIVKIGRLLNLKRFICKKAQFVIDALFDWKPM